jgi:outer membrane protein assembly factor BamB
VPNSGIHGAWAGIQHSWLPVHQRVAYGIVAIGTRTGEIDWIRNVAYGNSARDLKVNSRATPTMAATRERLVAYFGSAGLYCVDHSGMLKWKKKDLPFDSSYGVGHSPVICDGTAVIVCDRERNARGASQGEIIAIDVLSGNLLWRQPRTLATSGKAGFGTPIIHEHQHRKSVLVRGWEDIRAYDLLTGSLQWSCRLQYGGQHLVASMVADEKRLYVLDAERALAVDFSELETGRATPAWCTLISGEKSSSPALHGGLLYLVSEMGVALCLDSDSGKIQCKEKLKGRFFSSFVITGVPQILRKKCWVGALALPQGRDEK